MKKLLLFFTILILSQCQINVKPKTVQAQEILVKYYGSQSGQNVKTWLKQIDGMTYRIFLLGDRFSDKSIFVINITKEKLEIEKLKLEIKKLKIK